MRKRERHRRRLIARRIQRNLPAKAWRDVHDPRGHQGRQYRLHELLQILALGMMVNAATLRDVENLAMDLAGARHFGVHGSPSDTTFERIIRQLDPAHLRPVLYWQVRQMHRSKRLQVIPAIGISLVAIDGKVIATDSEQKHPEAQAQGGDGKGPFVLRVLRAAHVGSSVKPVLDQLVIPGRQGEANNFVPFVEGLLGAYGRTNLLECVSVDAGFTTRYNMHWLEDRDIGFIAALKGDQPTLFAEARRLLGEEDAEPESGWETMAAEVAGSRRVTRWFARTREMVGFHGWTCIRQTWRVRQRVEEGGRVTWMNRYFVTNLPWGRLGPNRCLRAVQAHWGIENDSNWTLDAIWKEDQHAWVRMDTAPETLGILRMMACNLIRLLRHRVLRAGSGPLLAYRRLLEMVRTALTSSVDDVWAFT